MCQVADKRDLLWLKERMEEEFELKTTMIGWEPGMEREMKILNRIVRCTQEGVEYEADQRHAEIAIRQLDVEQGNSVLTPYDDTNDTKTEDAKGRNHQGRVDDETATIYKSIAARLNYLSPDCLDIQYAGKEVCRRMSCPTWLDYAK